jgi:hypothetical protein
MRVTVEICFTHDELNPVRTTISDAREFIGGYQVEYEMPQLCVNATVDVSFDIASLPIQVQARSLVSVAAEKYWELVQAQPKTFLSIQPNELFASGNAHTELVEILNVAAPLISEQDAVVLLGAVKTAGQNLLVKVLDWRTRTRQRRLRSV